MTLSADDRRSAVKARRALREELLLAIYDAIGGSVGPRARCKLSDIPAALTEDGEEAIIWLKEAGLLEFVVSGPIVALTVHGIEEAERIISPIDDPLESITAVELRSIEAFERELDMALEREDVTGADDIIEEIRQLLKVLQQQTGGRPRRGIVRATLGVVMQLLIGMGGNFATDFAKKIPEILSR